LLHFPLLQAPPWGHSESKRHLPPIAPCSGEPPALPACPELQSLLPAGWRYATPEEEAMKLGGPSTWVTSFAEPLVMGDQALAYWSAQCPGLCAQMMVVLYRRGSKGWSAVGPAAIAMS